MKNASQLPRYNQRIRQMVARASSGLRIGSPHLFRSSLFRVSSLLWFVLSLRSLSLASSLDDSARQLADRIAAVTGPGAVALEVTNRSSLGDRSLREVRSALEAQLRVQGVSTAPSDQSVGTVSVILSESVREYVWTAQIAIGSDPPRVALVSLPRETSAASFSSPLPITLKKTFLISQQHPILDAALVEMSGSSRLLVLDASSVDVYRQQSGRWEPETSLPISSTRPFPRDIRGRLILRRDRLFDAYLPGVVCRASATPPLTMDCLVSDDPWPLLPEENSANIPTVRAFYASARNFFTGALSPGLGKITNVPSFYSAAALPRANYTLWALAAVDGSVHLIDGFTDQAIRAAGAGSDLAAIRSNCGIGTQLLVSGAGDAAHDELRAFEIPDRELAAVGPSLEFDGSISALWPDATLTSAIAIVKRGDTGWYEANRISVACAN